MDRIEIFNALQTIKETRSSYFDECYKCPFVNPYGECKVTEIIPKEWELEEERPIRWRAFK